MTTVDVARSWDYPYADIEIISFLLWSECQRLLRTDQVAIRTNQYLLHIERDTVVLEVIINEIELKRDKYFIIVSHFMSQILKCNKYKQYLTLKSSHIGLWDTYLKFL